MSDSEMAPVVSAEEQALKRAKMVADNKKQTQIVANEFEGRFASSSLSTHQMFLGDYGKALPIHAPSHSILLSTKAADEYASVKAGVAGFTAKDAAAASKESEEIDAKAQEQKNSLSRVKDEKDGEVTTESIVNSLPDKDKTDEKDSSSGALITWQKLQTLPEHLQAHQQLILRQRARASVRPVWHAPWKLMRVISGHLGWVRCAAVDPANEWFVTGSNDRTIKIWDLASGVLKLTLTGHISIVRALCVSNRHPYLFSTGDDKTVKCWDLEYNKVVRHYHGHLSGVYSMNMHPTLDVLMTGGRDSCCRVWDIRTKAQVMVLGGHSSTVASIETQTVNPQVVTGSHDSTIRLWDLVAGKSSSVLTNHKKSVRALHLHPTEFTFASASADNMKVWKFPEGKFLRNVSGHNTIINTIALNHENVMVSGGDNGSVKFWDWKSGYNFQSLQTTVQPGSMDSEAGIMEMKFDMTGSRLISCESDKTIKIYKEDAMATEETHPIDWKPSKKRARY